ncbi:MAG: aminopeptidase [Clostridia bacterium]|nr:aminopeptidase [Clostridia bacterium]
MENKSEVKALKEKLFSKKVNGWKRIDAEEFDLIHDFCEEYKVFLNSSKTEREAVDTALILAKAAGFKKFNKDTKYNPGDKVYKNNRGKSIIFTVFGKDDIEKGVNILASHIDSPRLDLKQHPLYEENDIAYFKTHYYGGIRKYQWPTVPLSLHGVIIKSDGTSVQVCIGEDEGDMQFVISDLLPHLAAEQNKRTLPDGIKAEELNIIIGSCPFNNDEESELVKLNILNILFEKYGITEDDFVSAELEAVPAFKAVDIGFDRSMIGSYGHDDRVCAFPALMSLLDIEGAPNKTAVCVLADKEEIGSYGNTGLNSDFLKNFIWDIAKPFGVEGRTVLENSECLSADVNSAYDPTFSSAFEARNSSYLGYGAVVTKYTGARGKSGTSDASAEYVGKIRNLLDSKNVVWQTGELGKTDLGGGGTVAMYIASLGVDVIDLGVPVLSMHAPFETVSKLDVYMTYRTCYEFIAR